MEEKNKIGGGGKFVLLIYWLQNLQVNNVHIYPHKLCSTVFQWKILESGVTLLYNQVDSTEFFLVVFFLFCQKRKQEPKHEPRKTQKVRLCSESMNRNESQAKLQNIQ